MSSVLEQAMPSYHFHERHSRWINAAPIYAWNALTTLTLNELALTRSLIAIRFLGQHGRLRSKPVFTNGPVHMFDVTAPAYAVGGAVARPWQLRAARREVSSLEEFMSFAEPGWAKYLVDFQLESSKGGVQLTTETRVYCTDKRSWCRFALYWALIRPGSGLIRRNLLATTARLAEHESRQC